MKQKDEVEKGLSEWVDGLLGRPVGMNAKCSRIRTGMNQKRSEPRSAKISYH